VQAGNARKAELLDRTRWAADFSFAQLETLAGYLEVWQVEAGRRVVEEGSVEGFLCIIAEGAMDVVKRDTAGQPRALSRLSRGATVGEMSLLDHEPRSASVVAAKPSVLLVLKAADLDRLARDHPALAVGVYRTLGLVLSRNLRRTSGQLVDRLGA